MKQNIDAPHLWIPRAKIIEPKRQIIAPVCVQGLIKIEAGRRDGRRRLLADWFPNLITDAGLDSVGSSTSQWNACKVGTGNNTPTNGDTAMQAYVAGTTTRPVSDQVAAQASPPYYSQRTMTFRFAEGAAAGNLAEVGFGQNTTNDGVLWSRARVLDGGGTPTTITVLSDEFLDVSYQLRNYPFTSDVVDTINISGTDYDYTLRAAHADELVWVPGATGQKGGTAGVNSARIHSGAMGTITESPSGSSASVTGTNQSYSAGTYQLDFQSTWGLSDGNFDVLSAFTTMGTGSVVAPWSAIQMQFDPVIPKTSSNILSLTFRHAWARKTL